MLYKMLIVDDEAIIRDGLSTLVDWESMGFSVAACFEDGKYAIDYIEKEHVDVILTDIKMTFISGLELSSHISRFRPEIKVVIISGYKDFDYAKQAISYNVVHYLLKPTRMDELHQVFENLKSQLDREREEKSRIDKERQQFNEFIPLMQEQFFTDLLTGGFHERTEIDRRIHLLNLNMDAQRARCSVCKIRLHDYENYLESEWKYGKEGFFNAIRNLLRVDEDGISCFPVHGINESMFVLLIGQGNMEESLFNDRLEKRFSTVKEGVSKIFGIEIDIESCQTFESLYALALNGLKATSYNGSAGDDIKDVVRDRDYSKIIEQQKLFVSYITAGNIDAVGNLFDNLMSELRTIDIASVHNFIIDLFSLLCNRLKKLDIDIYSITKGKFNYHAVLKLNDIDKIQQWGRNILNDIIKYVEGYREASEKNVIRRAKEYIKDNYNKDISLDDVADHVYLSTVYFSRIFKQLTGENFIDYLIKVRMDNAMELLQNPRYKTYEVCHMVGYKSIRYFSRIFKKYTGFRPTEYRSSLMEEDELSDE